MAKDSKEKILKVAIKQFAKNGYEATSTRDICSVAGVNVSAISYYFKSKKGLYEEVLKCVVDEVNLCLGDVIEQYNNLKSSFPNPKKSCELLRYIVHKFIEAICLPKLPKNISDIYLFEYVKPSDSFYILADGLNNVYMSIMKDLIFDANKGKLTSDEATLYTFMLFSQIFNVAVRREPVLKLMNWKDYSKKEVDKICEVLDKSLII